MGILADDLRGGGRFISWKDLGLGVVVTGTITEIQKRQCLSFEKKEPEFWSDGKAKEEAWITVRTSERLDADDDGERVIVINLWSQQKKALGDAVRASGLSEPRIGDEFSAIWSTGAGGSSDPRHFAYKVTPGTGLAADLGADPWASAASAATAPAPSAFLPAPAAGADPLTGWDTVKATPAPAAPAAPAQGKPAQAKELLAAGIPAADVAEAVGLPLNIVTALANTL